MPIYLTEKDVESLLTMDGALDAVEDVFRERGEGRATNKPRYRVPFGNSSLQVMSAAAPGLGVVGVKAYTAARGGARFHVHLYSAETGELLAMLEANALGQIRTGAATGVATRHMARDDASVVGMIGCGYQARAQLEAVCAVRVIREVKAFSPTADRRETFSTEMSAKLGVNVTPVESAEEATSQADVVVAITSTSRPVLEGKWLRPGTHVNAAGGNHWMRRELDEVAVRRAEVLVVDDLEQAKVECGDLISPVERGVIRWEQVAELSDVVTGRVTGRESAEQITLFESQGIALEDIATGLSIYELAKEKGVGFELPAF
jgi:ornithine cyclodeaminase/alanine dehydrogenase-like protein (mu-crystallin family)